MFQSKKRRKKKSFNDPPPPPPPDCPNDKMVRSNHYLATPTPACQGSPRSTTNNNNQYTLASPGILSFIIIRS